MHKLTTRSARTLAALALGAGLIGGTALAEANASVTHKTAGCRPTSSASISGTATATPINDRSLTRSLHVSGTDVKTYGGYRYFLQSITVQGYPTKRISITSKPWIDRWTNNTPRDITLTWSKSRYLINKGSVSCTIHRF